MTLLGCVSMIDPARDEAVEAVRQCRGAGIRVVMITGDHAVTASAIASRLALADAELISNATTGTEIDNLSNEQLRDRVKQCSVFARASPEHKLRLVRAFKANNEIVAMTGDGVNDAPALKQADVGVAMVCGVRSPLSICVMFFFVCEVRVARNDAFSRVFDVSVGHEGNRGCEAGVGDCIG